MLPHLHFVSILHILYIPFLPSPFLPYPIRAVASINLLTAFCLLAVPFPLPLIAIGAVDAVVHYAAVDTLPA